MKRADFPNLQTRRVFFRDAACAALGTISLAATIRDLRLINAAAAQNTPEDLGAYKALVCIFLSGGNDSNNLIVPYLQSAYDNYANVRQNLALPRLDAMKLNLAAADPDGHEFFMHPSCGGLPVGTVPTVSPVGGLWKLFDEGKLGVVCNVGPLSYPMTRTQYSSGSVPRPPQLFSHSDQVTHWQTSLPDHPPRTGWGGRIADLLHPLQYDLNHDGAPDGAKISLSTSLAGANTFEVGSNVAQYHVSTTGAVTMAGMTPAQTDAIKGIINVTRPNLQDQEYGRVVKGALETGALLNSAIDPTGPPGTNRSDGTTPGTWVWNTPFPTSSIGNQLKMIARIIQAGPRSSSDSPYPGLNMKRQIFFASVGSYDTHTSQTGITTDPDNPSVGAHANLLYDLSQAMFAFQRAMEQLTLSQSVTSFTASDFGRTFTTNGQGSDHGWGGHHMVMGGAVQGKRTYGSFPVQQVNGPDDTGLGRWIPKIAVDQYSATLAKWFGVSTGNMTTVFPNLGRFASSDLGFLP